MEETEISRQLFELLKGNGYADVTKHDSFKEFMDSLDKLELFIMVDRHFGIHTSDEDVLGVDTVQDLVDLISQKLSAGK